MQTHLAIIKMKLRTNVNRYENVMREKYIIIIFVIIPVVDDSPPSGGLAELDPVLIISLVRVL